MEECTDRVQAVKLALDDACRNTSECEDPKLAGFIAAKLADAALLGLTTLGKLRIVARKALADYRPSIAE